MTYFLVGLCVGIILMFLARIADKKISVHIDNITPGKRKKPIILENVSDEEKKNKAINEILSSYGADEEL